MNSAKPWIAFEPKRENVLSMLHAVQEAHVDSSHIPTDDLSAVAEYVGMPIAELEGVASFYGAFARRPRGRHVIRLCDSLSCRVRGSVDVYRYLSDRLGIGNGGTTLDGKFSLEVVNCLGSCDSAPNLMIDDTLLTNVTPGAIDAALEELP